MTLFTYFIIPLLALILAVLDTSFFSFHELLGATVITSFSAGIILAVLGLRKHWLLFAASSLLFFTAFSSLPLYILIAVFLGLPLLIFYIKNKIFFESSLLVTIVIFTLSNFAFRLLILPASYSMEKSIIISTFAFTILNTLAGIIFFVLAKKMLIRSRV